VSQQFNPISLSDHMANGRPWDLDRTMGGLLLLQPRLGHDDRGGFQQGTADALWRYAPLIRDFAPAALVVVSADAVYALDYDALVEEHMATDAAVTMVTTEVEPDDAARYGVVQTDDGKVTEYVYKPDEAKGNLVSNEVFVFRPDPVFDALEEIGAQAGEEGLKDLGHDLLPRLVDDGGALEHRFEDYWRDVGTIQAYWNAHQDLLRDDPPMDLDSRSWPILTRAPERRGAARVRTGAAVQDSMLGPASTVAGTVERSVIGRGVVIEPGAVVRESVLQSGCVVRSGATVVRAVLDEDVEVAPDASVGAEGGEIALVGLRAVVPAGTRLEGGARFPELDEG
jgi:glucose-1-phosphate adenylyltransferase